MKKCFIILAIPFFITSCRTKVGPAKTLIIKNFISEHTDWKSSKDTNTKDIAFGFKDLEIPAKVSWVIATDTSGCLRIGFFKLERKESDTSIKIFNLNINSIPCAMKWNSSDKRRFETLIFNGEYSAYKGIKEYSYKGSLGTVKGNGEFTLVKFY